MKFDGYRFDKVKAEYDPSADLISREETLTAFADYVGSGMSMNDFDALWDIVAKMPAVNPTKTGHWIEHPEIETSTPEYLMFYECSECRDKQCFCKSDIHKKHFCNNCGARMIEPQESEKINCKSTKCENCINHNYCDYEPQERSGEE